MARTKKTQVFVALLRGINVGGKNKVEMKKLKKTFEQAGLTAVVTYINSGNVVFVDAIHRPAEIPALLEKAIQKDFKLDLRVVVRSLPAYEKVLKALPKTWSNDDETKSDVLFLRDEVDEPGIVQLLGPKKDIDTVKYVPGAVLWKVDRKQVTRSGLHKLIGTKLYQQVTIRNVNTTRKIHELMLAALEA